MNHHTTPGGTHGPPEAKRGVPGSDGSCGSTVLTAVFKPRGSNSVPTKSVASGSGSAGADGTAWGSRGIEGGGLPAPAPLTVDGI